MREIAVTMSKRNHFKNVSKDSEEVDITPCLRFGMKNAEEGMNSKLRMLAI